MQTDHLKIKKYRLYLIFTISCIMLLTNSLSYANIERTNKLDLIDKLKKFEKRLTSTINKLKTQIDKIGKNDQEALKDLQNKHLSLTTELKALTSRLNDVKGQLYNKTEKESRLIQDKIAELSTLLNNTKLDIENRDESTAKTIRDLEYLLNERANLLNTKIGTEAGTTRQNFQDKITKLTAELTKVARELDDKVERKGQSILDDLQNKHTALTAELTKVARELDDKVERKGQSILDDLQNKHTALTAELNKVKGELNTKIGTEANTTRQNFQEKITKLTDELTKVAAELNAAVERKAQSILDNLETKHTALTTQLNEVKVALDKKIETEANKTRDEFVNEIAQLRPDKNQLEVLKVVKQSAIDSKISKLFDNASQDEAANKRHLLSGEIHSSIPSFLVQNSNSIRLAVESRIRSISKKITRLNSESKKGNSPSVWLSGGLSSGLIAGDGNASDLKHNSLNISIGSDISYNDFTFGGFAAYSSSSLKVDERKSTAQVKTPYFGAYASGQFDNLSLHAGALYASSSIDTTRSILPSSDATDTYNSKMYQVFSEVSYGLSYNNISIQPFTNFVYSSINMDPFHESGDFLSLSGKGISGSSNFATLGLRVSNNISLAGNETLLHSMVGWRYAFGDLQFTSHNHFNVFPSHSFPVKGVQIPQSALILNTGLDVKLSSLASFGLAYNFEIGGKSWSNDLDANFKFAF